ncbi:MAG: cobalamin-dependent protein [Caloramator sp.]|nr:cobalamin-dependent protein [Caloramator sp.]
MNNSMNMNNKIFKIIMDNKREFAEKILNMQYKFQPELKEKYTKVQHEKCLNDIVYHLSYLAESIYLDNADLFIDYSLWAKILLQNIKIPTEHLIINFECIKEFLKDVFNQDEASTIIDYISSGINILKSPIQSTESYIKPDNPYFEIASKYLNLLLNAERAKASEYIMKLANSNINIKDIYILIFEPSLKEIGRLWQINKITVAQEHYFTASTQLIMSQLYNKIFTTEKIGLKFVGVCIDEELHEVGIRMVSDILEIDGWDTYYLGANVPKSDIVKFLLSQKPHAVGISSTMTYNLHKVADIIEEIKNHDELKDVKILVGGYAFNINKNLYQKIGADYYAENAVKTSEILNKKFLGGA